MAGRAGRQVEALGRRVRVVEVDRRRHAAVADRQDRRDRLDRPGRAEGVAEHRLVGRDGDRAARASPKIVRIAWSSALSPSGVRRRVGVDVVDLVGRRCPAFSSARRAARTAPMPARRRQRDVRRVGGRAVADQLGQDRRAARLGVLELLEDDDAGALADDEPVAPGVERARGAPPGRRCGSTARASPRTRRRAARRCRPRCRRRP